MMVVHACVGREGQVLFDVIRGELHPNRNSAADLAHAIRKDAEIPGCIQIRERRRRDGRHAGREAAHLCDLPDHVVSRKMSTRPCLRALPPFEMKRLHPREQRLVVAKHCGRQFVPTPEQ
jgi:hypothetical protein